MKQLIVMVALLPLLISLIMQVNHSQINMHKQVEIERAISTAEEQMKVDGYLSNANKSSLKENIAIALGTSSSAITVTGTTEANKKYRVNGVGDIDDSKITYTIEFKFEDIMAANELYGITDEDNSVDIVNTRTVISEKLAP